MARLEEFGGNEMFPVQKYKVAAIRALIANKRGQIRGKEWAKLALEEAAKTHTGFRYHPNLCLVGTPPDPDVHRQIKKIAGENFLNN